MSNTFATDRRSNIAFFSNRMIAACSGVFLIKPFVSKTLFLSHYSVYCKSYLYQEALFYDTKFQYVTSYDICLSAFLVNMTSMYSLT